MRDSSERVQYIADYLCSYKTKIEALNKNGLFDTATLYELFAAEVCKLWFGQDFINLNTTRSNYPYVDLVSKDGTIYVQVSTGQDIPSKVKTTLEKIVKSSDPVYSEIHMLYFFVLGNDSIERVPEYTGKERIGNVDFSPEENLISIKDIIEKAKTNYQFQKSLYDLLYDESESFRSAAEKLYEMTRRSKAIIQNDIDGLINGEYEINRSDLISKIKAEGFQNISIIGDAGAGKSALCKKLVFEEELMLFTRAENINELSDIDCIWNLNISSVLRYLKGRKIVFFIDALEFIADGRKSNIDLLLHLYEVVGDYDNAYIVTSCRTSDKNAFIRLVSTYDIHEYVVPELTDEEIAKTAMKYPVIKEMLQQNRYSQLLRSPFYLNMIVEQIKSKDDLDGTNGLRGFIWDNVICMKNKALPAGITSSDIRDAVNRIVFTRAQEFSIGIPKDDVPDHVLRVLLSKGIILQTNDKLRLRYDIFEDICFEQLFDREFDKCKGDFQSFFASLTCLGRCVYRRYQIWVENKLFLKEARASFLYSLVFSNYLPEDWKKQTIIGITKSRFCKDFFSDYGVDLIERGLLTDFLDITNLYSFETNTYVTSNGYNRAYLRSIGVGRGQLIEIAKENNLYNDSQVKKSIIKMCIDYSKSLSFDERPAKAACEVLEIMIDRVWKEAEKLLSYSHSKEIIKYLNSLYLMAQYCSEWVKSFWKMAISEYKSSSRSVGYSLAEEILENTFKNTTPTLAEILPLELTELAWVYWVERIEKEDNNPFRDYSRYNSEEYYGLNEKASHYSFAFNSAEDNTFFQFISSVQFETALRWVIKLSNYSSDCLRISKPNEVHTIELKEFTTQKKYSYYVHPNFFFVGVQEYNVPTLIGDAVFSIRQAVFRNIDYFISKGQNQICLNFVNWIKRIILDESNNTMLLGLLEDIGLIYFSQFPGYSILFASSIDIIMNDSQREIMQSDVMHFLGRRYHIKDKPILSLKDYIRKTQLFGSQEVIEQCETTLDYLYSLIPNDEEHAIQHLQIQKMDLRNADAIPSRGGYYIVPRVTGAAEEVVKNFENSKGREEQRIISQFERQYKESNEGRDLPLADCLNGIEKIQEILDSPENALMAEEIYIKYIACALNKNELEKEARSAYCIYWIDGIYRIINNKGIFVFDKDLIYILFEQADRSLTEDAQASLKRLFLAILLNKNHNGIISKLGVTLKQYLPRNECWSLLLFNTIIELAKDEMHHNHFNAQYTIQHTGKGNSEYLPNISPKPSYADTIIKDHGDIPYQSQQEAIIQKYLLNEEIRTAPVFDINQYDISVLCRLVNCGMTLYNEQFYVVIRAILHQLIEIWHSYDRKGRRVDVLDTYDEREVCDFLKTELINPEKTDLVIDLLFSEVDFSKAVSDTYEFYEEVLIGYLPNYVDAYNDNALRRKFKMIAEKIENRIHTIVLGPN